MSSAVVSISLCQRVYWQQTGRTFLRETSAPKRQQRLRRHTPSHCFSTSATLRKDPTRKEMMMMMAGLSFWPQKQLESLIKSVLALPRICLFRPLALTEATHPMSETTPTIKFASKTASKFCLSTRPPASEISFSQWQQKQQVHYSTLFQCVVSFVYSET